MSTSATPDHPSLRREEDETLVPSSALALVEDEPVIFLDLDGVLNTVRNWRRLEKLGEHPRDAYGHKFCPDAVEALTEIIEQTDASIVISSTWRVLMSVDELCTLWERRELPGTVIDVTPRIQNAPRGWEICEWIRDNRSGHEYKNYAIIDDDSDMMYGQRHNFVHTPSEEGLTVDHVDAAVKMLLQPK